jgi:hypothetical protein
VEYHLLPHPLDIILQETGLKRLAGDKHSSLLSLGINGELGKKVLLRLREFFEVWRGKIVGLLFRISINPFLINNQSFFANQTFFLSTESSMHRRQFFLVFLSDSLLRNDKDKNTLANC